VLTKEKRPPEARERRPEMAPTSTEPAITGRAASGGKSQSGPREVRRQASSGNEQKSAERPTSVKTPVEQPVRRPAQRVRGKPVRYTPSAEQSKDLSDKMSAGISGAAAASSGEKLTAAEDYLHVSEDGQYLCRLCPEIKNCKMRYRFDKHLLTVRHQNRAAADIAARAGERAGRRGEASVSPRPAAQTAARPTKQLAAAPAALNESTKELRVLLEHCPLVGGGGRNARRPRKSSSDEDEGPMEATAGTAADTVSATTRRKSPRNPQPRRGVGQGIMRHAAGQAKAAAMGGGARKAAGSGGQKPQPKKRKGAGDGKARNGQKSQVRYRLPIY